jgi:hypothetical protein
MILTCVISLHITSHYIACCMVRAIPQSLRLQLYLRFVSLDSCHKWGECMKLCVRISVCFCSWSSGSVCFLADPLGNTSVARIQVGYHLVPSMVLDDLCCLPSVVVTSRWAKLNTLSLIHGGCYHVTEVGGLYALWDSRWRLSFNMTRTLQNYLRYTFFAYCCQLNFLLGDLNQTSLVKCSLGSCEFSITLNSLIRVTCHTKLVYDLKYGLLLDIWLWFQHLFIWCLYIVRRKWRYDVSNSIRYISLF